jgi:hypothetical protein
MSGSRLVAINKNPYAAGKIKTKTDSLYTSQKFCSDSNQLKFSIIINALLYHYRTKKPWCISHRYIVCGSFWTSNIYIMLWRFTVHSWSYMKSLAHSGDLLRTQVPSFYQDTCSRSLQNQKPLMFPGVRIFFQILNTREHQGFWVNYLSLEPPWCSMVF